MGDNRLLIYFTDDRNPPRFLDITDMVGTSVPPTTPPENLNFSTEETEDLRAIFFFWDEAPRATGYNLYIDGVKYNENPIENDVVSVNPFPFPEGVYEAYVTALVGDFETEPSNTVKFSFDYSLRNVNWDEFDSTETARLPTTATNIETLWEETNNTTPSTDVQIPAPTNFDALAGEDDAIFSWDSPGGVDGYNLYLDSGSGYVKHNSVLITGTEYAIDGGLASGSYSAYAVSVFNGAESDPSNSEAFSLPVSRVPQNLTGERPTGSQIDLNWDDLDTIFDSYTAYVKNVDTGLIEQTVTDILASEVSVTGLDENNDYECWVVSVKDGVDSDDSNHVTLLSNANTHSLLFATSENDFIQIPNHLSLMPEGGDFTIEMYVKIADASSRPALIDCNAFEHTVDNGGYFLLEMLTSGAFRFLISQTDGFNRAYKDTNGTYATNSWIHLAVTWSPAGDTIRFFINGQEDTGSYGQQSYNGTMENNVDIFIGSRKGQANFHNNSLIDEVRVWKGIARSQAAIQSTMETQLEGNEPNLNGYWKFNEGSGLTVFDSSPNTNDGTLNGPSYSTDKPFLT